MNFKTYLSHQMTEDRRAFIVHFPAKSGKTQFARRVCQVYNDAYYLDLQAYFLEHPEISPVGDFDFEMLRKFLLNLNALQSIIVVDNPDFLFNTWDREQKKEFVNWINRGLRSPNPTQKTFIFFLQDDPDILLVPFDENIHHEPRSLTLNSFDVL